MHDSCRGRIGLQLGVPLPMLNMSAHDRGNGALVPCELLHHVNTEVPWLKKQAIKPVHKRQLRMTFDENEV